MTKILCNSDHKIDGFPNWITLYSINHLVLWDIRGQLLSLFTRFKAFMLLKILGLNGRFLVGLAGS